MSHSRRRVPTDVQMLKKNTMQQVEAARMARNDFVSRAREIVRSQAFLRMLLISPDVGIQALGIELRESFSVDAVASIGLAVAYLRGGEHYAVIVVDAATPGVDGNGSILRDIRQAAPLVPMILLDGDVAALSPRQYGVAQMLTKPIDIWHLLRAAKEVIG